MRILLIGGSGFIGTHVGHALVAAGHAVTALSRARAPRVPGIEHRRADRRDPASLGAALEGQSFDAAVDFTAFDAADLEAWSGAPEAAFGCYLMISTGQVYLVTRGGRMPYHEGDSGRPLIPEPPAGTPDHREWLYGVGKRRAEAALLELAERREWRPRILRLPIVLGEGDASLRLWAYLERMLDGGPLLLPDGGRRQTRFLAARDVGRAVLRLLDVDPPERVYNLAQPEILTLRSLLTEIARAAAIEPKFVDVAWDELEREGLERSFSPFAGPWASVLDAGAAEEDWGFRGTPAAEYLAPVVRWHLDHRPEQSHPGYVWRPQELEIARHRSASAAMKRV